MYNASSKQATTVFTGIAPEVICSSREGTIFIYDPDRKRILQLAYNGREFVQIHQLGPFNDDSVVAMCYSTRCDNLVLIFDNMTTIRAIKVGNGQTVWQHSGEQNVSLPYVTDICNTSDSRICITSGNSVFALDPTDGSLLETLLDVNNSWLHTQENENLGGVWKVISCHGKIAIRHGDSSPNHAQITCYNVTSQQETDATKYSIFVTQ